MKVPGGAVGCITRSRMNERARLARGISNISRVEEDEPIVITGAHSRTGEGTMIYRVLALIACLFAVLCGIGNNWNGAIIAMIVWLGCFIVAELKDIERMIK